MAVPNQTPDRNTPIVGGDQCATLVMFAWMQSFAQGISTTIVTAPLTGGGTPGSMTFVGGILTDSVQAT